MIDEIHVIDSHTAGEPTRVVVDGGPDLGGGTVTRQLERFRSRFDHFRTAIVKEPRGSDVMVGAVLCPPSDESCVAGVMFINNVGYLGMCGHGMIGVLTTLRYLGRVQTGHYKIETPVGIVTATIEQDDSVSMQNVESYRLAADVKVDVDGVGSVVGDVAWGGNWFFLVSEPRPELTIERVAELQPIASAIRRAVRAAGYPEVDHIELFGEPQQGDSDSRNFVLCPGLEYDRSPCGTGTSAKLACLAADHKLHPGDEWVQEGILGTLFRARFEWSDQPNRRITPVINGTAYVTADSRLKLDPRDPFRWGIDPAAGPG